MARKLTYDRIATTEDTDDPVIRADLEDTGSWMNVIVAQDEGFLRVAHVESMHEGDMSTIMDDVVEQVGIDDVQFTHPIDELVGDDTKHLLEKLEGFEERTLDISDSEMGPDRVDVYEGTWNVNR